MVLNPGRHCAWLAALLLGLVGLLLTVAPVAAADPSSNAEVESPAPLFPQFSQVAPYTTELQQQAADLRADLSPQVPLDSVKKELTKTAEQFRELLSKMDALGDVETWYSDRVLDFDQRLRLQRRTFANIQDQLTADLERLEQYRQVWTERQQYLQDWQAWLRNEGGNLPEDAFRQADATIGSVLGEIEQAQQPLLALQQSTSRLLADVQQNQEQLEAALRAVRIEIFRKNSHSFFAPEFYQQFGPELFDEVRRGMRAALTLHEDFFPRFGWLIIAQLLLALLLPLGIRRFHRNAAEPEGWDFLLHHPWATGIFVAVAALGGFYHAPPPLIRFLQYAFGVGSLAILVAGLVQSRRRGLVVLCLTGLFLISTALRMISLPPPLFRGYLLILYLVGAPLLWWVSVKARRSRGKLTGFILALRLGAALVALALVAQLAGYTNLSFSLVQASVETLFAYLFLLMALKLGFGGIEFLLGLEVLQGRQFIRQHGWQLAGRLKKLFRLGCTVYVGFFLLQVWGLFDNVSEAWESLLGWSMAVGETELTLRMLLLAGVTLYLTYQLSWFLQASIDTQVLQRRQMDRGVRDAIKKLLHYALVLVGFMLAISALGFQLQHLVVVAGAFGVGIGFGLQDIANNFLSGLILLFERPVKVGDGILIDGEYGTVVKIGLRSTVVETLDQAELIVPNSQMISQKVTNWTLSNRRVRLVVPVGVAYGSDMALVVQILADAGSEHPDVLEEPAPSPIFVAFGDSSLDFELRVWIPNIDMRPRVKSELLLFIDRRFRDNAVEIPFPQRDLHVRSIDGKLREALGGEKKAQPAPGCD